ncbi:MAG: T9SS type A sorting domain-containing protein [Flavobacteriia bacterium]|nr:T9SS type A sorting domain-containing protein [Flavobacteriia bacterium]
MKKSLLFCLLAMNAILINAQDTTWVQTFTFDSITSRRAIFDFPQELNSKRFEKVLMYYKLKCSPLTTWDQYNCGEWDYLTYTTVNEHTGIFDSTKMNSVKFKVNESTPTTYNYRTEPFYDTYQTYQYNRTLSPANDVSVISNSGASMVLLNTTNTGNRVQFLVTANELTSAGILMGDITNLAFAFSQLGNNTEKFTIKIKSFSGTSLTNFETIGFTTVYEQKLENATIGLNNFIFSNPFNWDGTSNLVVEITFENPMLGTSDYVVDANETIGQNLAVSYPAKNGVFNTTFNNYAELDVSNDDFGGDITISFWSKGNGSAANNTSLLEAVDSLGNRVLNIHFPWSDNTIYFDGGSNNGYDRISKASSASILDGAWHHWSFVKKTSTGQMFIYLDGVLWHSGTGLNRPIGKIAKFIIGSDVSLSYDYQGSIDEFSIFKTALSATNIAAWKNKQISPSHPNYNDLILYYDFDNEKIIKDKSVNNRLGMPSEYGMINFNQLPVSGVVASGIRPAITFGQGVLGNLDSTLVNINVANEPQVIFEYAATDNAFQIVNTTVAYPGGTSHVYDYLGAEISSLPEVTTEMITNDSIYYYKEPVEKINNIEISRYITPYGISFDLGPNGFSWIAEVTDYQKYLKNSVDLSAHNTQELVDLKFAFIEGIPPRDVHDRQPIWSEFMSYNYGQMAVDTVLKSKNILLSDTSSMFKIKTRITGHGQQGNAGCCEWNQNFHKIALNGQEHFNWTIWQSSECATNPNIGQGGTWPYAREGWCPGDLVKTFDHEITPFVTPGTNVAIDYSVTPPANNDQAAGGGNYVAAFDLISYSAPNFQTDGAIADVLNPNNWEYYSKWNPTCSNPRVIIQNTGAQDLTSCKIRCWITPGNYLDYTWNGNLAFLEKEVVEIPVTDLSWWTDYDAYFAQNGNLKFSAQILDLNGVANSDEYANNDIYTTKFAPPNAVNGKFLIWFSTNNKASENKYKLVDQNGTVIFERLTLANSTTYKDTFDLAPGCYSVILEDSDDDGIGFWYSSQTEGETTGQFRVKRVGGSNVEAFPSDFGRYYRTDFSVGFTLDLNEKNLDHEIKVFPNPNNGIFNIEINGFIENEANLEVFDIMGRKILTQSMNATALFAESEVDITNAPSGAYIVKITTGESVYTKQFIKR